MKRLLALVLIATAFAACKKTEDPVLPEEKQYHYGSYSVTDSVDEGRFEFWDEYTQSFFPEISWSTETQMSGGVDSFRIDKRKIEVGRVNQEVFFHYSLKPGVSYKGLLVFPDKYKSIGTTTQGIDSAGSWCNISGNDSLQLKPGGIGRFYYAFYNNSSKLVYTKGHYDIQFIAE